MRNFTTVKNIIETTMFNFTNNDWIYDTIITLQGEDGVVFFGMTKQTIPHNSNGRIIVERLLKIIINGNESIGAGDYLYYDFVANDFAFSSTVGFDIDNCIHIGYVVTNILDNTAIVVLKAFSQIKSTGGTGGGYTQEQIEDFVGNMVTGNTETGISVVYDDANSKLNFDATHNHTGTYEPANSNIQSHISDINDPHNVTATQVGLGNCNNTSDTDKPISTATQTALDLKIDENTAITGATKTKITYDIKGLITTGTDATTADITDSTDKRYVSDAQLTIVNNTSGTNTGDQSLTNYFLKTADDLDDITDGTTYKKYSDAEKTKLSGIETGADITDAANVAASGAAMASGAFHDGFSDFVGNEHLDWTTDLGATNIHSNNIPDLSSTYATSAKGVTNGDSHDHAGGDGSQIDHTGLANLNSTNYTHLSSVNHTDLTDSGDSTLHYHSTDRNCDNHTSGTNNKVYTSAEQTKVSNLSGTNTGDSSGHSGLATNGANTDITSVFLSNTGLKIKDINATHGLTIKPNSDLTADKTLNIVTGDFDRSLTLTGDTNIQGTNTGDQTLPVKATGAEADTGTDDDKFLTAKAAKDSHNIPSVAPSTSGNVLTSNGTDWTSAAPTGGSYTDEQAQDAVAGMIVNTTTINATYTDATPELKFEVLTNASVQKIEVTKNSGAVVGTRKQLNLIEGSNVTLTIADDSGNDHIDITIESSGGAGTVCTGAEINTGTNNSKYASPLAITDSDVLLGTSGTFTPTITLSGAGTIPVYTTNIGRWKKIPSLGLCFVSIFLDGDGGPEGSGTVQMRVDLPFTASADNQTSYLPVGSTLSNTTRRFLFGQIAPLATYIELFRQIDTSAISAFNAVDQSAVTRTIRMNFWYEI